MAEQVLFSIAGEVIEKLSSRVFEEFGLIWGVKDELQKLKDMAIQLHAVLLDAEQKQVNDPAVKVWLQSLEDAVYDADDVVDEFYAEAQLRSQVIPGDNLVSKQVCIFFSSSNQLAFRVKMGHKVKDINKRLKEIVSIRGAFHLEEIHEDSPFIFRERITYSFVPQEEIIGRDKDKRAVIQLLLDPIFEENVSTISVVGFGGLGKTALAQLIFNDGVVQNHFELKMWTCVSNVFELDILVRKILGSANEKTENLEIDKLQNNLRRLLNGKRFLLVLDDVWNEDREKWLSLKHLLIGGAKGSKMLLTTRNQKVATISDTAIPYTLSGLDQEQSWSLFKKMAFEGGRVLENAVIKEAGEEIARKCHGVPLAIRTIGGMLYSEHLESKWLTFKNTKLSKISQNEGDILPTLKLSYDVLPSHLKHCFAYCSLFPPDYEIPVERLIKLWVAQGFVKSSDDENKCLDDVGYEYFWELFRRSFFQEERKDELGIIKSCKMHDLMNELAIKVAGNGSTIIDLNWKNFDEKLCHVSFNFDVNSSEWKIPTPLLKANKIRTFLFLVQEEWFVKLSSKSFCSTIVSNFESLRMLSLNALGMKTVPRCLSKMKHLRYLDLSHNPIKRLPNWIVRLQNLETIDLTSCQKLVELPRDIKRMINLRHLILEGCMWLARMPRGLDELTGLRTLSTFVISNENNSSMLRRGNSAGLGALGILNELRGNLVIQNLRTGKDVLSKKILKEKHLHSLSLKWIERWRREDSNPADENEEIMLLEALQPHPNLKRLYMLDYSGSRFANWLSSLVNIVFLELRGCDRCQHLPPLDHLPSLKTLWICNLTNLEYISHEDEMMMSASRSTPTLPTTFFPSVVTLTLEYCPNLKGWWRREQMQSSAAELPSFPCLSQLFIEDCPNLTSMPLYPNLEMMKLRNTSWKFLAHGSTSSSSFSNTTDQIECSEGIVKLTSLVKLEIASCPNLTSLPEGIGNLTSLQELYILDCSNLASLPGEIGNLTSLQQLWIWNCSNLASLPEEIGNLTSLQHLYIRDCSNLASLPEEIGNLTSLQQLTIGDCSNLTSLPEEIGNLTSLQRLEIWDWSNLASLPEEIGNLTSLQQLMISNCSNLTSLPEGIRRLTSLNLLEIENCSILQQKCKKGTGEDWPKIAHIPHIRTA